jgi:hypothetical protein
MTVAEHFGEALDHFAESGPPLFEIDQTVTNRADYMRVVYKLSDQVNFCLATVRAR